MSSNSSSSSSSNSSLPSPLSSPTLIYCQMLDCLKSTFGVTGFTVITVTIVLFLLPLYIFVLYFGFQHRRSGATTSHSDLFTYHMVTLELINIFGSVLFCCAVHAGLSEVLIVLFIIILSLRLTGQMLLHILTCVERYLAVVHPITYLRLRNTVGIRIRNVALACVWLLSMTGISVLYQSNIIVIEIFSSTLLISIIAIISFCSVSVLRVLRRPGPAGEGRGRQLVDQSKLRAFYTVTTILGVLLFQLAGNTIISILEAFTEGGGPGECVMTVASISLSMPSSAVLPLLYLHRTGKLVCCRARREEEATH